jgi:hypothetical protein
MTFRQRVARHFGDSVSRFHSTLLSPAQQQDQDREVVMSDVDGEEAYPQIKNKTKTAGSGSERDNIRPCSSRLVADKNKSPTDKHSRRLCASASSSALRLLGNPRVGKSRGLRGGGRGRVRGGGGGASGWNGMPGRRITKQHNTRLTAKSMPQLSPQQPYLSCKFLPMDLDRQE